MPFLRFLITLMRMSKSDGCAREILMTSISWKLASIGQLAILLEASSPKPGNVNRNIGFSDTDYRHFLASASLMGRGLHMCATRGAALAQGEITPSEIRIGDLIHQCALDTFTGINRRNTILGTILLYTPLVVASSATVTENQFFSVEALTEWLKRITEKTSVEDTLGLYKTFHLIRSKSPRIDGSASWTETHNRYDIDNPHVMENIIVDKLTLIDLFKLSASVDEISSEWANNFSLTLNEVFPYLDKISDSLENLETRAEKIRQLAEKTMNAWNHETGPLELMVHLDNELRIEGNLLNPGTTADLVSAGILCKLVALSFPEI